MVRPASILPARSRGREHGGAGCRRPRASGWRLAGHPAVGREPGRAGRGHPFALRLARYCARNPLALDRLTYKPATEQLTYRSDKTDGPTAGTQALDPPPFLARLLTRIPDPGQVMTRYYGWYASRTRGTRARLSSDGRRLTAAADG